MKKQEPPPPPTPRRKAKVSPFVLHPEVPSADRHEYHITDDNIGVGTPGERFNNNIRAIRLLKKLEREDRFATPEEQAVLAQYVGWGGLADCFDEHHSKYVQLSNAKQEVEKPFPKEEELRTKSARLDELNILLNMDKRDSEIVDGEPGEDTPTPARDNSDRER